MIQNIIFDFGGVLSRGHLPEDFSAKLSLQYGLDKRLLEETFNRLEHPYELGNLSPETFWNKYKKNLNIDLPVKTIQNTFYDSYRVDVGMMNLLQSLKRHYRLILLTNNYEDMFTNMKDKFDLKKYFDSMYSSSSIHIKKPEKEAYRYIINDLRIRPKESLMIDDKLKNLTPARELGFETILFKDIDQLKTDLTELSVKVD